MNGFDNTRFEESEELRKSINKIYFYAELVEDSRLVLRYHIPGPFSTCIFLSNFISINDIREVYIL